MNSSGQVSLGSATFFQQILIAISVGAASAVFIVGSARYPFTACVTKALAFTPRTASHFGADKHFCGVGKVLHSWQKKVDISSSSSRKAHCKWESKCWPTKNTSKPTAAWCKTVAIALIPRSFRRRSLAARWTRLESLALALTFLFFHRARRSESLVTAEAAAVTPHQKRK